MKNQFSLLATFATILLLGTGKAVAEDNTIRIVADHSDACIQSEMLRPKNWWHMSLTPLESFTSTSTGKDAIVLNRASEQFIMTDGSRAYARTARFTPEQSDNNDIQSGTLVFTLPGRAVLKEDQSIVTPAYENVRMSTVLEMGPTIKASCMVKFSKPVIDCKTDYPYALIPPPFNVEDCKIIGPN